MTEKERRSIEIERKYIIEKPSRDTLSSMPEFSESKITQIYLLPTKNETNRIRRRERPSGTEYTETRKIRIDEMSVDEIEREITEDEFGRLAALADSSARPINKTRYTFLYCDQLFEIDVYPEWENCAVMETELDSREKLVEIPEFIRVIADVTGNRAYSNAAMSRVFPDEPK